MKDHIYFFILFTVLEVALTAFYCMLVKTINLTVLIGLVLYAAGMCSAYLSYREELYRQRKKNVLDSFLNGYPLAVG